MSAEARFHELFGEHYPAVARYVLARGFQAADADDLIAATFEVAWRRLDAVPAGEDALPWLLSTARNLARNADRKARRERTLVNGLAHARSPWSEAGLERRAEWDGVRLALAQLRPVDRDLILLVAWDGLSPTRAGSVLGLRPVTARSRLHRARQRLTALLHDQGISAPPETGSEPATTTATHTQEERND
jgi:RNA polymerase sigma-70 factor (ECF subfamily)